MWHAAIAFGATHPLLLHQQLVLVLGADVLDDVLAAHKHLVAQLGAPPEASTAARAQDKQGTRQAGQHVQGRRDAMAGTHACRRVA